MKRWSCLLFAAGATLAAAADRADQSLDFAPHLVAAIH